MGSEIIRVNNHEFKLLIAQSKIAEIIDGLANGINEHYSSTKIEVVIVLKGAVFFAADLLKQIQVDHQIHFVKFTSYEGMQSNVVRCDLELDEDMNGKHVLILEDIIDSGKTMNYFVNRLQSETPASIQICSLLVKPNTSNDKLPLSFIGAEIDDGFVIGYGMDYDESCRSLQDIYQKI